MFGLLYPQKQDFLKKMRSALGKDFEELDLEKIEIYIQEHANRSPKFKEEIEKSCQHYKGINKIR